jgi:alpha/beta superfamily hydrolase
MVKYFPLLLVVFALSACKKATLDGMAFPAEKLDNYTFSDYSGEISIPDSMHIDPSMRTLVSMTSYDAKNGTSHTIYGVYIGDMSTIQQDTVILYMHGQAKHMDHYWARAALLAHTGGKHRFGVFMFDYRGYGMSEGEPSEQGLYEDANAAIDWLLAHGVSKERTVFYGYSLGAIPAIDRAALRSDFSPAGLITEAPLASVQNLVTNSTLLTVESGYVTTLEFPNSDKIKLVSAPYLWFHGVNDTYVAIQNGELIFNNYPLSTKEAIRVDFCDHTEVPLKLGYSTYLQSVESFITQ